MVREAPIVDALFPGVRASILTAEFLTLAEERVDASHPAWRSK